MLLIKNSFNWADEMDLDGFCVVSEERFEQMKSKMVAAFEEMEEIEIYFGTNESNTYKSIDKLINMCKIKIIDKPEWVVLKCLFGNDPDDETPELAYGFSFIYFYEHIVETLSWENDEDE